MVVGGSGAIYLTGAVGNDHGQAVSDATSCDDGSVTSSLFVMKLSPQLGVEWFRRFGALSGSATGAALAVDEAANLVVVTGSVTDEVTVGDHVLDGAGQDVFVIAMTAE
ncbi:MAG: hypothetical protein JRI68_25180 [Deltaproteobacteria bacterium]|nr:hypothetical protein [Deltaproteobacteria bacterium]